MDSVFSHIHLVKVKGVIQLLSLVEGEILIIIRKRQIRRWIENLIRS